METGLPDATIAYLKKRAESLNPRERLVSLIIDEVYSARQVEYMNGQFFGNENHEPTKTLLCMMLKGIASKYSDIVVMVPLTTINAKVIKEWWTKVLEATTPLGFDVVATLVDAHSSNRRFYIEELCGGKLQPFIPHPFKSGSKMFLLFDSVHIFKNVYNNLLNRKEFKCPPFEGKSLTANVEHVQQIYRLEMGRPVRYAHKLTDRVLNPKSIEKTNVDLACRFFHESTVHALDYFAKKLGHGEWQETADFFRLILRFWNTVNVKNPRAGFMKRDDTRRPISENDWSQVEFLEELSVWLSEWQNMPKKNTLTRETFIAIRQTVCALSQLAVYLLTSRGLKFVLLGMINSDPLERRFGWFRQLSGANYFASVRQFLEAEKKIRIKCLVKHGNVSLQDVREVFSSCEQKEKDKIVADTQNVLDNLACETLSASFELERGEEGIVFFIAGYTSRGLLRATSCAGCVTMIRKEDSVPAIEFEEDDSSQEAKEMKEGYLKLIDRGGLVSPSDLVNVICVHVLQLKQLLFDGGDTQKMFLETGRPRDVFEKCFMDMMKKDPVTLSLLQQTCQEGHCFEHFVPKIVVKVFNIFSKNFVSVLNDKIHEARKRATNDKDSSDGRKIAKLQSKNGH